MPAIKSKLDKIKKITSILHTLSAEYIDELFKLITEKDYNDSYSVNGLLEAERFADGRVCPHCNGRHIVRNGHRKSDGVQRYVCRCCGKSFVANSNSITAGTRKMYSVWRKYIQCMMDGFSIRKTAKICKIHRNTAFAWRHKILDALQEMQDDVMLSGIVEADEKYFPLSFKGNHKNSKTFVMPREARKHGHKIKKAGLHDEFVCVLCAVNRRGLSYAKVGKTGKVNYMCLQNNTLSGHIDVASVLCTDKEKSYIKLADVHCYSLIQVNTREVKRGIYHIQHVNSYHSRLKMFMYKFRGVSTKYLNNYIVWHNFANWSKETYKEKIKILLDYTLTRYMTRRYRDLSSRIPIPTVA